MLTDVPERGGRGGGRGVAETCTASNITFIPQLKI